MKSIILAYILLYMTTLLPFNNNQKKGKTYLALGDSYTIGQSVQEEERFPAQTVAWLKNKNITVSAPRYIATTGWTTTDLLTAIENNKLEKTYDIVTLLIGVNDQYQRKDMSSYRLNFTQLLTKAIQLAGNKPKHVVVLSIPDYSVTPFARNSNRERIKKEIDEFNRINKELTLQYHCHYLDITSSTREAAENNSFIAKDGLHPSGLEYRRWAERLGYVLLDVL